jgi:hypothetical protein
MKRRARGPCISREATFVKVDISLKDKKKIKNKKNLFLYKKPKIRLRTSPL